MGGRWTPPGQRGVYLASSPALGAMEVLVHLGRATRLDSFVLFRVSVPDRLIGDVALPLPDSWANPVPPLARQRIGRTWLDGGKLGLRLPSAVVRHEWCVLLNVDHKQVNMIQIDEPEPFGFDARLG